MSQLRLPPAERDVLACIYRLREPTARQLREALHSFRPMAHGSVLTLLNRLEAKGLVAKKKGPAGKAFIYRATQARQSTFTHLLRDLVHRVFEGDPVSLVASLFETRPPTKEEVARLEAMLKDLRRQRRPASERKAAKEDQE
jgi:BlaI family transcriptional regulator, penicillinase repressor